MHAAHHPWLPAPNSCHLRHLAAEPAFPLTAFPLLLGIAAGFVLRAAEGQRVMNSISISQAWESGLVDAFFKL
ncbi:hypothetical protein EMIT0324P_100147 [Pseudomonas chlororaphis]